MSIEITPWVRYIIVFLIICHGYVYIPLGTFMFNKQTEANKHYWLWGEKNAPNWFIMLKKTSYILTGIIIFIGGIALGFTFSKTDIWKLFLVIGPSIGIVCYLVFGSGQLKLFFQDGGIGLIANLLIIAYITAISIT